MRLSLSQKVRITIGLLSVFLLVFMTNRLDKQHFEAVQDIINEVYEDRIVAQDYVYSLSSLYHYKYEHFLIGADSSKMQSVNNNINETINLFGQTKLTNKEAAVFRALQRDSEELLYLAERPASQEGPPGEEQIKAFERKMQNVHSYLDDLAVIQLEEGERLKNVAQESLDTNSFFSQLELLFLIVVGLIIQVVIFVVPMKPL